MFDNNWLSTQFDFKHQMYFLEGALEYISKEAKDFKRREQ